MQQRSCRRFRATVHYDGGGFHGWQLQPDVRTVQGSVEDALAELFPEAVRVDASGRTDRGVHAAGQEIAFPAPADWGADEMRSALNALLPADVWIETCREADGAFHPRFDARARRYLYLVATGRDAGSPLRGGRVWQLGREPDLERLSGAAALLPGERSFEAFAKSGQPERGHRCRIESAAWSRTPVGDLAFRVVADRFLHHMVRYLVHTMVEIGLERRDADAVGRLLADGSGEGGARPPAPAPPEGLYLTGVRYAGGWNRAGGVPGLVPPPVAA